MVTKKDNEYFENFIKSWICENDFADDDVKVWGHCHITGKYKIFAHEILISRLIKIIKFLSHSTA